MFATNVRNLKRNPSEALRHAEQAFAGQRKGLLADTQALIARLNQIGYRIAPAVIVQLATHTN